MLVSTRRNWNPHTWLVGMENGAAPLETHSSKCPLKLSTEVPYDPASPFLGTDPREMETRVLICTLYLTAPDWPQRQCPSVGKLANDEHVAYPHTRCCQAARKCQVLTCATTWVNLKSVTQKERGQVNRPHIVSVWFCLYEMPRRGKSSETESRWGMAWAGEERALTATVTPELSDVMKAI